MANGAWWLLSHFVLAHAATPDAMMLVGPRFTVHLEPAAGYTVTLLTFDGAPIVDASSCGSCQGTVIRSQDGPWLGSCHGGESVQTISLWVDGIEQEVVPGMTYSGALFELDKTSTLGDLMTLRAETVVTRTAIREHASLTTLLPDESLAVVYPFLSTHGNTFTEVMGVQWPQQKIIRGTTDLDNGTSFQLGGSYIVAQYDPAAQRGVSSFFWRAMATQGATFVWDRNCDNKLYYRFLDYPQPVPLGSTWSFRTIRFIFFADTDDWEAAARRLPGDFNHDDTVDLADFARFQGLFGLGVDDADADLADFDNDGTVDADDHAEFAALLTGPE